MRSRRERPRQRAGRPRPAPRPPWHFLTSAAYCARCGGEIPPEERAQNDGLCDPCARWDRDVCPPPH